MTQEQKNKFVQKATAKWQEIGYDCMKAKEEDCGVEEMGKDEVIDVVNDTLYGELGEYSELTDQERAEIMDEAFTFSRYGY